MENLPVYIEILFFLTTILTLWLLSKSGNYSRPLIIIMLLWLALQAAISLTGFYAVTKGAPPRFAFALIPPIVFITLLFLLKKGKHFIAGLDTKTLTLLHIVRIPVELILYWLYLHKAIPQLMTFEGRNFDVLSGLTAALVYYFGYIRNIMSWKMLLAWNIICLLLLANIVVTAVLSAPTPFQKFGFDQPNIAFFYFPFVWLPGFIVPSVLFAHLVSIKKLANSK
jgi:hypothetical protein